jgi:hypothetical protein
MFARLLTTAGQRHLMRVDLPRFQNDGFQAAFVTAAENEFREMISAPGLFVGVFSDIRSSSDPRIEISLPWASAPEAFHLNEHSRIVPLVRFWDVDPIRPWYDDGASSGYVLAGRAIPLDPETRFVMHKIWQQPFKPLNVLWSEVSERMTAEHFSKHLFQLAYLGMVGFRSPHRSDVQAAANSGSKI